MEFFLFVFVWLDVNDRMARPPVSVSVERQLDQETCEAHAMEHHAVPFLHSGELPLPDKDEDGYPVKFRVTTDCYPADDVTLKVEPLVKCKAPPANPDGTVNPICIIED